MVDITVRVNGATRTGSPEARKTLADFLRDDLDLTGTHVGCEHGVCGACTVIVDGRAVRSCMMLAVQAAGSEVTTIEGLAPDGELGPLQQAMWDSHSFQCGFCTPGFVMQAAVFLGDHPDAAEQQIREALSGNICRCTGYQSIIDGVLLAAAFVRSPMAHARVLSVDVSAARALPGVVAVLTGADLEAMTVPGPDALMALMGWAGPTPEFTLLATDKVRFVGDPMAIVVAESRYIAEDGCELVEVEYDDLPPVVTAAFALDPSSPPLFANLGDNIARPHSRHEFGDVAATFANADRVIAFRISVHRHQNMPMEGRGCVTYSRPTGQVGRGPRRKPHRVRTGTRGELRRPGCCQQRGRPAWAGREDGYRHWRIPRHGHDGSGNRRSDAAGSVQARG